MSQNDFVLANASGASFRADANSALQALASSSSGATAPSLTYAYQYWFDTTTNIQKQRNGANTAWVNLWSLVGSTLKLYEQGSLLLGRANTWTAAQTLSGGGTSKGTRIGLPRGHIDGLILANSGADATNDIDVAAGEAADDANGFDLRLAATLTKQLDALWAVGTNQGGLDAGSKAPDTWYHVWLIARSDTGVTDVLFSTSATAPSLPTNYDKKRRIGAVLTDSTAAPNSAIIPFIQVGDKFLWTLAPTDYSTTITTTAANITISTPLGIEVDALLSCILNNSGSLGSDGTLRIYHPNLTDQGTTGAQFGSHNTSGGVGHPVGSQLEILTDTSSRVRAVTNQSMTVNIVTDGWTDPRGKNA